MKKTNWKVYAFWMILAEAVGALSGWLTRKGVKTYNATIQQPTLSPPSIVFPIVWGILFVLMGIGAARGSIWLRRPMLGHAACCCSLYSWRSISSGALSSLICKPLDLLSFG